MAGKYWKIYILCKKKVKNNFTFDDITILTKNEDIDVKKYLFNLSDNNKDMWIRHVLVPGITDSKEQLTNLKEFISTLNSVKKVEILPYHTLGVFQWEQLGIPYGLENVNPPTKEQIEEAKQILQI